MDCWDASFPYLDNNEAYILEIPFSKKEIHRELMGVDGNKALGLNGFLYKFFQSFWSISKEEFITLFNLFFETIEFD